MPTVHELMVIYASLAKFVYGVWTTYVAIMTAIVGWYVTLSSAGVQLDPAGKALICAIILIATLLVGYAVLFQQKRIRYILKMIEIITSEVASPDGYNEAIRGFTYQFKDYSVYLFLPAASLSIGALIFFSN